MTTADEDAFYVLTGLLLTPAQFPSVLADDYPAACGALALEPWEAGYGLVLGQDAAGARWTLVTHDAALVGCAVAAWDCGLEYDLDPPERTVVATRAGWPLALAVQAPGVPAPHDPEGADGPLLAPPDPGAWGPAQRRMGADDVGRDWRAWRGSTDAGVRFAAPGSGPGHEGVARVLREAAAYLGDPPPPGRVRSAPAADGARTVRADGPGWSLVARTDDIAFVLLDEEPGQVLPVGRGPSLPGLLEGLDRLAREHG
ncbi:hypothetical protein LO771_18645 [Streptacidiphilus sp. ASG 303]|uniref:hypothetical protein n=1 Tax=Streptacidiphilus sp. ASG 303 TaxID=2896847 RepID=UPI001E398971|nr:hypothetical protein [Streptacidiphilus sp. ASG 303]MCD0484358.1 hypothetical protein [Streptacidiphilus sp. ASG 303]